MNRLVAVLASCDMADVASLRRLYDGDDKYYYYGTEIICGETHRNMPEYVRFTLRIPLESLGLNNKNNQYDIKTADFCLREFIKQIDTISLFENSVTGKKKYTGEILIHRPGQQVLLRNSSYIKNNHLEIMFRIMFPVHMKERHYVVAAKASIRIVRKKLAKAIRDFIDCFDMYAYEKEIILYARQQEIRSLLNKYGLVSFVANGSILPRKKDDKPLDVAVAFISPEEDEFDLYLSDGFIIKGMGIREGITVITGGGYSGKSTFLEGVLDGIYDHILGDGREYCITRTNSCKILAEEGRIISNLDISPFISDTSKLNTKRFTSLAASGSTSQAANIIEALSFGCKAIFIDEDKTATNFMIRDARMKKLIPDDPIIPFTDRVRQIYEEAQTSTIMIIGGSSEYLDITDNVYMMTEYVLNNITARVNNEKRSDYQLKQTYNLMTPSWIQKRYLFVGPKAVFAKDNVTGRIREYLEVKGTLAFLGNYQFDVTKIETITSKHQLVAITFILRRLLNKNASSCFNVFEKITDVYSEIIKNGLDSIYTNQFIIDPDMELPTIQDALFTLSRITEILVNTDEENGEDDEKPVDLDDDYKIKLLDECIPNNVV
jgi:predicted ABC-class ATPase